MYGYRLPSFKRFGTILDCIWLYLNCIWSFSGPSLFLTVVGRSMYLIFFWTVFVPFVGMYLDLFLTVFPLLPDLFWTLFRLFRKSFDFFLYFLKSFKTASNWNCNRILSQLGLELMCVCIQITLILRNVCKRYYWSHQSAADRLRKWCEMEPF